MGMQTEQFLSDALFQPFTLGDIQLANRMVMAPLTRSRAGEDNVAFLQKRDRRELGLGVREVMKQATVRIRPRGNDLDSLDRSLDRVRRMVEPSPTSER